VVAVFCAHAGGVAISINATSNFGIWQGAPVPPKDPPKNLRRGKNSPITPMRSTLSAKKSESAIARWREEWREMQDVRKKIKIYQRVI
jgi:hypothetical protein